MLVVKRFTRRSVSAKVRFVMRGRRAATVTMLLLGALLVAAAAWAATALTSQPGDPGADPCGFLADHVAARSIGASSWGEAKEQEDADGVVCTYPTATGEPMLTMRSHELDEPRDAWTIAGRGNVVCGAVVRSEGPISEVSGERWSVQLRVIPATHGITEVPEPLVVAAARAVATTESPSPAPIEPVDLGQPTC